MSQQQGFGTGNGGGPGGDVKSICITENVLFSSSISLAAPICILPDANGAISFTADPPIILTAIPNGLNISFSGSTGGIGFLQGNDAINVGPDAMQVVKVIGNNTQGVSVTNTGPNELTVTVADATPTQKGVVTLGETGAGIITINTIPPDGASNFTFDTDTDNVALFNVVNVPGSNKITLHFHQVDFHPNNENVVTADNDDILIYGEESTGITTLRFTPQNNGLLIRAFQATPTQRGTLLTSDNANTLTGTDLTTAVTPASLSNKLGTQVLNSVIVGGGSTNSFTNSNVGTDGQILFAQTSNIPLFGNLTSNDNTLAIAFDPMTNSLDLRVTGSLPGTPNIEFLAGNDAINVGPDPTTHVLKVLGNMAQGIQVTNTGPFEITVTAIDATPTQKGVVTLGEVGAGITTINFTLPDGSNNFNITATVPYTVTPGTNSVNISDNGGVPYQFVADTGNPVAVTGNSFTIKGSEPVYTQVFDNKFYVAVNKADYGFYGVNRLAFDVNVLSGTGKQSVTCETLRSLTGPLTANTVLISTGPNTAITNSSLGTAGQALFSNGGNSIPNFGSFTSTSGTVTFSYNETDNSLDLNTSEAAISFTGDTGTSSTVANIYKIIGDLEQGVQTAASSNQMIVSVLDSSTLQKGVIQIADSITGIAGTDETMAMTPEIVQLKLGNLTKYAVAIGDGLGASIVWSNIATDPFQIFTGNSNNNPRFSSLISSSGNITISYSSPDNTIDINANIPVDPLPLVQLSSSTPLSTNTCYMFIAGSDSYALPTTSAVNDLLELKVQGATSYTITQAAGQSIFLGNTNTTVGTGGFFTCNGPGDWIRLRCTVANTTWVEFGMSAQSFLVT